MPYCINCGRQLADGARFCAGCGTESNLTQQNTQRKTVYDGEIHKCPNCGEVLNSFVSICPACGFELRGKKNSDAVQQFATKLLQAETIQQKVTIIRNFPVPNTKEDILEFMILAYSNVGSNIENDLSVAWLSKIEQAYQKAQLVIKDEKEFLHIQNLYSQVYTELTKQKKNELNKKIRITLSEMLPFLPNIIVVIGWLISIFVLLSLCDTNLDNDGTNSYQLILVLDFIGGAMLIPLALKCASSLPKCIASFGLIISIIILILLCGKNSDDVVTESYQLLLFVDIICTVIIFIRMFRNKNKGM